MKKFVTLLALLVSVFAVAACGSSNSKPEVTPDTLASSMDEVCTDAQIDFDSMGTRGQTNPQLALEFDGTATVRQAVLDSLEEMNMNDEAAAEFEPYAAATKKLIASDKAIAKAAADDDTAAVNEAFTAQSKAFDERDKVAKKLGTKVCGQAVETKVEPTGTAPPEDLSYAEPKNTIEEAADSYVKGFKSGNCAQINANRHSDAGELEEAACKQGASALKNATVEGTEQFGPVGQAEIVSGGVNYATAFIEDMDGVLRYAGDVVNDNGGLRPAPDGNDAQETVDATVAAIRDNDGAAFNATLPDEGSGFWLKKEGEFDSFSDGKYNKPFIDDVRSSDSDPVQLGLSSTFGFYYLEGSKNDWVLTMIHIPGIGGHYRLSGYWPVPKP